MRARWLPLLVLAHAASAGAGDVAEIISPRADAVSVTIYRDVFALITETRTVDLPAGPVTLSFDGVVETLVPASVVVTDIGRALEERNFDYDPLTPRSLFAKSIGGEVSITRTNRRTGKVSQSPATIVSANENGVMLRTRDGYEALYCSGLPEHVTFERIPEGLFEKPRLSVRLAAGTPGRRTVKVSYLAHGFTWKSDYVARLPARGDRMDLLGWVTLRNLTNTGFRDAQVQVVAGRLHLLGEEDRGTSLLGATDEIDAEELAEMRGRYFDEDMEEKFRETLYGAQEEYDEGSPYLFYGCFRRPLGAYPVEHDLAEALQRVGGVYVADGGFEEIVVTGMRRSLAAREELADYQLYRLPWSTDLNARQTKQAVFLDKRDVKVDRFYSMNIDAFDHFDEDENQPRLMLRFENRKASGLGEPLPGGVLRLFERGPAGDLFAGECNVEDTAVGTPVEKMLSGALDLNVDVEFSDEVDLDIDDPDVEIAAARIRVLNAKGVPVAVEIRQEVNEYMANVKIVKASHRATRKHGDFAWRLRVPANGSDTLDYRIRYVAEE